MFEFYGPGVANIPVSGRITICNMIAELGATAGIFPSDDRTREWLEAQERPDDFEELAADEGAEYDEHEHIELDKLQPLIAQPHSPGNVVPVGEVAGTKAAQVCIGSSEASGGGSMFGPRGISIPEASSGGTGSRIWRSSTAGFAGAPGSSGYSPSSRGSVMTPLRAVATAVVGLVRYTRSVIVPERPGKLRLKVLTLTESEGGACPIPTHGPHTGSSMRAPARTRSE